MFMGSSYDMSVQMAGDSSSSLIERTNNLRQWLQKAKISATLPHSTQGREQNVVSF